MQIAQAYKKDTRSYCKNYWNKKNNLKFEFNRLNYP